MHGKRASNGDALLLAARELSGHLLRLFSHAHSSKKVHGHLLGLVLLHAKGLDGAKRNVLKDGHVGKEVKALEHHAKLSSHLGELLALLG